MRVMPLPQPEQRELWVLQEQQPCRRSPVQLLLRSVHPVTGCCGSKADPLPVVKSVRAAPRSPCWG